MSEDAVEYRAEKGPEDQDAKALLGRAAKLEALARDCEANAAFYRQQAIEELRKALVAFGVATDECK